MVLHLVQGVAWIFVLGVLQGLHLRARKPRSVLRQLVTGLLFGGICVLGMVMPSATMPGLVVDARCVVLGAVGLFGGLLAALVAAAIPVAYSLLSEQADNAIGLPLLVASAGLGLLYRYAVARGWARVNVWQLLVFGLLQQLLAWGSMWLLPAHPPGDELLVLGLALVAVMTPAMVFLGLLIQEGLDREAREQALRESENRLRSLLMDIPSVSVQAYAADGTTRYWNKASEQLYGYEAGEVLGRNLTELIIPPEMRDGVRQAMQQMFATQQAIPAGELSLMRKDGSRVPVFSSHAYVQTPGQPAEMFCIDIDLSDRVRAESELRIAAVAFEAQVGVVVTNAKQVIQRVNKAFTQSMGYSEAECLGQTLAFLNADASGEAYFGGIQQDLARKGQWVGEIWSRRQNGERFPQWVSISAVLDGIGGLGHYVATVVDITQRKIAEDKIRQLAFFDPLTNLPNRRLFMDRLHRALAASERSKRTGALLYIDLDNFKTLNDTRGHEKGDVLLQQVAQRLVHCVRDSDTVARLGGDEFLVMLEDLESSSEMAAAVAKSVAEKIVTVLNRPFSLGDLDFNSTASLGVALFHGQTLPMDELLKQADMAMYQAKAQGRNALRFFDPAMQAAVNARAELEGDLRQALVLGQFLLFYQPQLDGHGQVTGAEALLRWPHPQRGRVSPADFIPLAEETGHILTLGRWVLETACAQLVAWAPHPLLGSLVLAVNVSARQFREPEFAQDLLDLLSATGANPKRLKLELTESMLVDNLEDLVRKMAMLRARGIGFSLDDFGTGYSSLSYLKRLPLHQLKIDQSFVRDVLIDPSDAAIARTVVALAQNLGLEVMAEGVETQAQKDWLARYGCHAYQGYLFSPALPAQDFERYVQRTAAALT
ncbi:MAG: EAL domain-containing protein [Burkholderiales bacterium]|nr:EAL domain-containing protein [Burkholderiales bacterium]